MTSSTYTPTPWTSHIDLLIRARGSVIGEVYRQPNEIDRANIEHIVCCVNSHAALVAALRTIADDFQRVVNLSQHPLFPSTHEVPAFDHAIMDARVTLPEVRALLAQIDKQEG